MAGAAGLSTGGPYLSPRQRDQVTLQPGSLMRLFELKINLVQIPTDPQEQATRSYRHQIIVPQTVVPAREILDAIGLGEEFAAVERINVKLGGGGLIAADEVTGQTDAGNGQAQASR